MRVYFLCKGSHGRGVAGTIIHAVCEEIIASKRKQVQIICFAKTNKDKGTHTLELALCLHLYSGVCKSTLAFVNQSGPLSSCVPDQHLEGITKSSGTLDAMETLRVAYPSGGILSNPGLAVFEACDSKGLNLGETSQEHETVTRRRDHSGLKPQTQPSASPPGFWRSDLGANCTAEALY